MVIIEFIFLRLFLLKNAISTKNKFVFGYNFKFVYIQHLLLHRKNNLYLKVLSKPKETQPKTILYCKYLTFERVQLE